MKQYTVQAKRKNTNKKEKWSEWTTVDDYEAARHHAKRAEEAGYDAKIIDRGEQK